MNAKSSSSKWPWLIELQESWHEFTELSTVREGRDWHQWQEKSPRLCLLWAQRPAKWSISFNCMWRKAICKSLGANVCCGWALWGLDFHISPNSLISVPLGALTIQTSGKWQFSLICGSPEPPSRPWNEFISAQWDANDWCYNNITPCHNQLCILKREEMHCSVSFAVLSPAWKDNDFNTNALKRFGSINTYCAQFFLTDFTRNFILLL